MKKSKAAAPKPTNLRGQLDTSLAETGRWRTFAEATQKVCLDQQRRIEELETRPLIGCEQCQHVGAYDWIDPETGEVARMLCGCCREIVEAAVDLYLSVLVVR